jgi:hypothetical protein
MTDKLVGALLDHELVKGREHRPSTAMWRGSLLGGCMRQQWYYAHGEEPSDPRGDEVLRIFERGHIIGDALNARLRNSEFLKSYEDEVPVEIPELNFAGNCDAVVQWVDDTREVWEYKSVKAYAWKYLPKPEHQVQAAIYAEAISRMRGQQHGARLVYIRADDLETAEYMVDSSWRDRALRILEILNTRFKDQIPWALPAEKYLSKKTGEWKFPCGYCEFRTKCRG